MTNKTREQAIEKLAKILRQTWYRADADDTEWVCMAKAGLDTLESLGYVQKDPDQSLPGIPKAYEADNKSLALAIQQIRQETQQDMLNAGWAKVEKE